MNSNIKPENVVSSLENHILVDKENSYCLDLAGSHGVLMKDPRDGKLYLDCFGNFSSSALGHNHPKLLGDPVFLRAVILSALEKPANPEVYTAEYAEFVETFAALAKPKHFEYMFFVNEGAVAAENAVKAAVDWKARKNIEKGICGDDIEIICFEYAFHGRTSGALSATKTNPVKTELFPRFKWPRVSSPFLNFPVGAREIKRVKKEEEKTLGQIEKIIKSRPYEIAAILIEPIQGEGGDNHFRGNFLAELRRVTLDNDVLLIFDEVQTGFGTTGKMWCYEHFGVKPDILVFGKKSRVCGIMASRRLDEVEDNVFRKRSRISSTWGGSLVDMVVCRKTLGIMKEDNLIQNARETGGYFLECLAGLALISAGMISNARGRGFFIAFDLPTAGHRDKFSRILREERLAHLKCGERSIRFRPPLIFSKGHVNLVVDIIEKAFINCKL